MCVGFQMWKTALTKKIKWSPALDHNEAYTYHTTPYLEFFWTLSLLDKFRQSLIFHNLETHKTHQLTVNSPFSIQANMTLHVSCLSPVQVCHCYNAHPFNGPLSGTTTVSRYQKGKTNLDFTVARDSEWQWHQLGHMQVCTSLQTDNHASTAPISFLQARCPTNSVKALKAFCHCYNT